VISVQIVNNVPERASARDSNLPSLIKLGIPRESGQNWLRKRKVSETLDRGKLDRFDKRMSPQDVPVTPVNGIPISCFAIMKRSCNGNISSRTIRIDRSIDRSLVGLTRYIERRFKLNMFLACDLMRLAFRRLALRTFIGMLHPRYCELLRANPRATLKLLIV